MKCKSAGTDGGYVCHIITNMPYLISMRYADSDGIQWVQRGKGIIQKNEVGIVISGKKRG